MASRPQAPPSPRNLVVPRPLVCQPSPAAVFARTSASPLGQTRSQRHQCLLSIKYASICLDAWRPLALAVGLRLKNGIGEDTVTLTIVLDESRDWGLVWNAKAHSNCARRRATLDPPALTLILPSSVACPPWSPVFISSSSNPLVLQSTPSPLSSLTLPPLYPLSLPQLLPAPPPLRSPVPPPRVSPTCPPLLSSSLPQVNIRLPVLARPFVLRDLLNI
ncbi:hypothetical protein BDK51DRAFT_45191 [Blyttiomyces helicus]|uniref:Uncharacterized protein n=1 Tax=Blyttiomyces helicus TaxID=388810 RepID=A0A4P9WL20_9FUNG|nr:hypothetical protein BDK51DRAFT_45191 [Blyttiomyces helicus]|eukprot:RKO91880.1 hypothetical protein BDK51DRAFT_45191 [Blyttiomyces helicus]